MPASLFRSLAYRFSTSSRSTPRVRVGLSGIEASAAPVIILVFDGVCGRGCGSGSGTASGLASLSILVMFGITLWPLAPVPVSALGFLLVIVNSFVLVFAYYAVSRVPCVVSCAVN